MARVKAVYRRLIFYAVILVFITWIASFFQETQQAHQTRTLPVQTHIIDKAKVSITPHIIETTIKLSILIESFENPDILLINPNDLCVIRLANQQLLIGQWNRQEQTASTLSGTLTLATHSIQAGSKFSIDFFLDTKTNFSWIL